MLGLRIITTTPDNTVSWLTLAQAKAALSIDSGDTTRDDELTATCAAICSQLEKYCDRIIGKRAVVEYIPDWGEAAFINLTHYPVMSGSDTVVKDSAGNVIDASLYMVDVRQGGVFHKVGPWGGAITVEYSAGFDPAVPASFPAALAQAAIEYLNDIERSKDTGSGSIMSESSPDIGSVQYAVSVDSVKQFESGQFGSGVPATVAKFVNAYRRTV